MKRLNMSSVVSNESAVGTAAEPLSETQSTACLPSGIPRWIDAVTALIALIVALPVIGLCAAAIVLTSGFPVLFWQQRVGQYGRTFAMVKLRTMKQSQEGPQITRRGDQRVTRLGKVLRLTKLDELPALWNVLRGEMSLVGPRPEVPRYVDLDHPLWDTILQVRPGLTDPVSIWLRHEEKLLAQAEGDSEDYYINELQPEKLKGYIEYLRQRTWRSDVRVLWRTLTAVVAQHE